jgi:hypothetical protein
LYASFRLDFVVVAGVSNRNTGLFLGVVHQDQILGTRLVVLQASDEGDPGGNL